jgi:hypothetical protein
VRYVIVAMLWSGVALADAPPKCLGVDATTTLTLGTATAAGEYTLAVELESASATNWGEVGNEALVLDVSGAKRGFIGHLIVHQGKTRFEYAMHVGALAAGEAVQVKVSKLSAPKATPKATVCAPKLAATTDESVLNAPEYRWPVQKSFNDVPLVVGWSKTHKSYITVMTNEDGGTAENCGGGASGMQAEIARWGRSTDIEDHYHYGIMPTWERCTGKATQKDTPLRMEAAHPLLYWGSGHNRLFESRGGYGKACGARKPEKPDGDLDGWNVKSSSDALVDDPGKVIVLRPVPVDLDALEFAKFAGRREAIADHYAPWMYRLTSLELAREGKIDNSKTFAMDRYLYVDVLIDDVGGHGDSYCSKLVDGGFKLRATTKQGTAISSPQITKAYAAGYDWKRVAIALPKGVSAADIDHFTFDAYDNDGIYLLGIGDAFVPKAEGDNGAKLDYVRRGTKAFTYYVDDNASACKNGTITGGHDNAQYKCVGGQVDIPK